MTQSKPKINQATIADLIPDNKNANKGTEYGSHLMEKSMGLFGAGRSILIDKNNRIIAGNKTVETAGTIGLENVLVVESTGDTIIAVKRTDVDLDTKEGRELAIADNATGKANLDWDEEVTAELAADFDIKMDDWGVPADFDEDEEGEPEDEKKAIDTRLVVTCPDVAALSILFSELQDRGFKCELKE